jgi:hypothetical protein
MKCAKCGATATKKVIWADGRAYQPACAVHVKAVQKMLTAKNGKMTELAGVQDLSDLDLVDSHVYPGLERKPGGPDNWVEAAGGLPDYIERIAKHLHYEKGMTISRAIAVAVNTVKRWAAGGTVTEHGTTKRITPKTQALAAKALASWEAKKKAGSLAMSEELGLLIDLSEVSTDHANHLARQLLNKQGDLAIPDTRGIGQDGAASHAYGTLRAGGVDLSERSGKITTLAERANRIKDPVARATARALIIDLAVNPTAEQRHQYGMADGSFPVWNAASLRSAILLAKTPAQRRHIIRRARDLGLSTRIPKSWALSISELAMEGILDLASTIAPRHPSGKATDGRRRYKRQGKWGHGFVPLDQAAKESKAKGSPIAIKRLNRVFGSVKNQEAGRYSKSATGRAGQRSAGSKRNPKQLKITEGPKAGTESAQSVGFLRHSQQAEQRNRGARKVGSDFKEASKQTRIPERARQNWDEIPPELKTVKGGKRYVLAEFAGGQYLTAWVGGVQEVTGTSLDKRKVYRTLATQDALQMSPAQLRDIVNNPKTSDAVKRVARKALKKLAERNKTRAQA